MANKLKTGDLINVIDWEGNVLQRRAVNLCGNLVFVCTDEELKNAKKEQREPVTVGWPVDAIGQ